MMLPTLHLLVGAIPVGAILVGGGGWLRWLLVAGKGAMGVENDGFSAQP
jgi:hypothetical protein